MVGGGVVVCWGIVFFWLCFMLEVGRREVQGLIF